MNDRKGFTLIELLIVVVIIGILAAIAIPKFNSTRDRSFRAAMMSDLRSLAGLQEIYHSDQQQYSNDLGALNVTQTDGITLTVNEATGAGWSATAEHAGIPNEQCGVYHGNAAAGGGSPAVIGGVIACSF